MVQGLIARLGILFLISLPQLLLAPASPAAVPRNSRKFRNNWEASVYDFVRWTSKRRESGFETTS
jgi:hypothetical protein